MRPTPKNPICEDFFQKVGGKEKFSESTWDGAKIYRNGQQHDCFTEEGPGDFGWCAVGSIFKLTLHYDFSFKRSRQRIVLQEIIGGFVVIIATFKVDSMRLNLWKPTYSKEQF